MKILKRLGITLFSVWLNYVGVAISIVVMQSNFEKYRFLENIYEFATSGDLFLVSLVPVQVFVLLICMLVSVSLLVITILTAHTIIKNFW